MGYTVTCLCGEVSFTFQFDPMMHFQCHCSVCQKRFGSTLNALAMPEDELEIDGPVSIYTTEGGSGNKMHYGACSKCSTSIWNKPEVLGGLGYLPAGLLAGQIEFRPTVELWSGGRPKWMTKASTIKESFPDNGTVERIQELLENLDQRN